MKISKQNQKSIPITQEMIYEGYIRVQKGGQAEGVDGITMADFKLNYKNYLYKIWNRMSSGSYFPPQVRQVRMKKENGGERILGIPTIGDRVAQMVIKTYIEPRLEVIFIEESYGYRRGKNAHEAIGKVIENCRNHSWVLDMDIKGFFDNMDHELLMKAVDRHIEEEWVKMYIKRWLEVGGGKKGRGVPQGGVISPILANLYLHYTLDIWLKREKPKIKSVRYSDDIVFHCETKEEAEELKDLVGVRLSECRLEMNEGKTKIVYCKDYRRREKHENVKFEFLGYDLKPRSKKGRGGMFLGYDAAISMKSRQRILGKLRRSRFHRKTSYTIEKLGEKLNPQIRGWINYYGKYGRHEVRKLLYQLDKRIVKWVLNKHKSLKGSVRKGFSFLKKIKRENVNLFAHWPKYSCLK